MLVATFLKIKKTNKILASMKNVGRSMGLKNISDLVSKEINGIYRKKIYGRRK